MDARERLRRYLEQRREVGEQELVLDRLDVDDVLRMVGALGRMPATPPSAGSVGDAGREGRGPEQAPSPAPRDAVADAQLARPGGISPDTGRTVSEPRPTEQRVAEPGGSIGDWRETLRAAGGGPPGPVLPPPGGGRTGAAGGGETDEENEMARAKKAGRPADGAADVAADDGPATAPPVRPKAAASSAAVAAVGRSAVAGGQPAALPAWAAELDLPPGLSVGKSAALDETFANLRTLDELARMTERCTRCDLYRTAAHAVPGEGNADADLVCVGEAPGANEDASGRPFVGAAGQLLTKILAAINLSRDDVFICNVLKHRPPGNRNPEPEEVEACSPYLLRQLELVKPKVILTLGTFAAQTLLATKTPIGKLRGQVHLYHGIPLVVTYHPAALLRNSAWKRPTWEDVQLARRLLDRAPGA